MVALLMLARRPTAACFLGSLCGEGQLVQSLESDHLLAAGADAFFDLAGWRD
jgi:hypothetical protein